MGIETGAITGDPVTSVVSEGLDFLGSLDLGGTAKKQERAARAQRDGALALRDKALADLETAKLMAASPVPSVSSSYGGGGGGIMDTLRAPSFIPGVPWWGVAVGGAVAAWALWPR